MAVLTAALTGCATTSPADRVVPLVELSGAFGLRDVREGWTGPGGAGAGALGSGMRALRARDLAAARRRFAGAGPSPPARLGAAYVLLLTKAEDAAETLDDLVSAHPDWAAAVEARADLLAFSGDVDGAWQGYRALSRLLPDDARASARLASLREKRLAKHAAEAEEALLRTDFDAARRAGLAAVETDPEAPDGYRLLARAASAGGKSDDAWAWAQKARDRAPEDPRWTAEMAEIAVKAERFAEARSLYEELSARDPVYAERADDARMEFQIQNLPEPARRAAASPRLTRSQFATLAWWLVPEVREASVGVAPEIAVDVVDRSDRREILRSIALGFFAIGDDHRFLPNQAVSRAEMAGLLRRLALRISPGRPLSGCLQEEGIAPLARCGLLLDGSARWITGKEGARSLDRTARMRRQEAGR